MSKLKQAAMLLSWKTSWQDNSVRHRYGNALDAGAATLIATEVFKFELKAWCISEAKGYLMWDTVESKTSFRSLRFSSPVSCCGYNDMSIHTLIGSERRIHLQCVWVKQTLCQSNKALSFSAHLLIDIKQPSVNLSFTVCWLRKPHHPRRATPGLSCTFNTQLQETASYRKPVFSYLAAAVFSQHLAERRTLFS